MDSVIVLPVADFKRCPIWVCRMCLNLAEAYQRSLVQAREHGCGLNCHGPSYGDTFPKYRGPLSVDQFKQWCYICGNPSDVLLRVDPCSVPRSIGCCAAHSPDKIKPAIHNAHVVDTRDASEPDSG